MTDKKRIKKIIDTLHQEYPNAEVSLDYKNPFQLLVATILSAQTTDKMVNKVIPDLFDDYPDAETLSKATPEEIIPYIKSIGLYNTKSKSLVGMAEMLVEEFDGEIPKNMDDLTKLPGVGRKTANVVLGNALGVEDSGITVDTHVKRLSKRMGFTDSKYAKTVEKDLMEIVPRDEWVDITHLFISHGRKICDRKPDCETCVVSDWCNSAFDFDHYSSN